MLKQRSQYMNNYYNTIPLTPLNYKKLKNKLQGGALDAPPTATNETQIPLTTTPPTASATSANQTFNEEQTGDPHNLNLDWGNMTQTQLMIVSPQNILNLTDKCFARLEWSEAFGGVNSGLEKANDALTIPRLNPNAPAILQAMKTRLKTFGWWIPEDDPMWNTTLTGIPKYWFNHPNQYSESGFDGVDTSQVIFYNDYQDFLASSFYTKYGTRLVNIPAPFNFQRFMGGAKNSNKYGANVRIQYGQKWRVIFTQGDLNGENSNADNWYYAYIDCSGVNEYLQFLNALYTDRDILMPEEAVSILHTLYLQNIQKQISDAQAQGEQEGYTHGQKEGYAQGQQAQQQRDEEEQEGHDEEEQDGQAQQQTQEEGSSDVWGTVGSVLGDIGDVAEMFL